VSGNTVAGMIPLALRVDLSASLGCAVKSFAAGFG
jgi:hypothetical protein